jgi:hypothetical protein
MPFAILLSLTLCLSINSGASSSHVMAVVLADGTIADIGHCDWSGALQPGQSQVDMGDIEIPNNVLTDYMVQGGVLIPRITPLTPQQYQKAVNSGS